MVTVKIDIPLPETCSSCSLIDENYNCVIAQRGLETSFFSQRAKWCPLKEEEQVKPIQKIEQREWTCCGNCGKHLLHIWKYCGYCGEKIDWNEGEQLNGMR